MNASHETFVGEELTPLAGRKAAPAGEPLLPESFAWRGREYHIAEVRAAWKESGPCKSGGGEMYLRKHWFHILTTDGMEMKIYFERQARSAAARKHRWWIFTTIDG